MGALLFDGQRFVNTNRMITFVDFFGLLMSDVTHHAHSQPFPLDPTSTCALVWLQGFTILGRQTIACLLAFYTNLKYRQLCKLILFHTFLLLKYQNKILDSLILLLIGNFLKNIYTFLVVFNLLFSCWIIIHIITIIFSWKRKVQMDSLTIECNQCG